MAAEEKLTEILRGKNGFVGFPINTDLNNIAAHIAVLGSHMAFLIPRMNFQMTRVEPWIF